MIWPDLVIMFANILLSYALLPQVVKGFKDNKPHISFQTGLITTIGMYAITISYFALGLVFSSVFGAIQSSMWMILLIQTIVYQKNKSKRL